MLAVLAAATAWGTSGTAQAVADLGAPVVVGAARTVSGALALWVAAAVVLGADRGRAVVGRRPEEVAAAPRPPAVLLPGRGRWSGAVVVAGLAVVVSQVSFFAGVAITGVAIGTVIAIGSAPVVAGLLQWGLGGRRPSVRWWCATALAVIGVSLVLLVGADGPAVDVVGVALALLAGSAYGVVTVASGRVMATGVRPTTAMARVFLVGGAPALVLLLAGDPSPLVSVPGASLVLWLGIVTVAIPYLLFARGLRRLPPATVGTLTLAEPLVAAVLGVAMLGERPGPASAVGGLLLVVGLALAARDR